MRLCLNYRVIVQRHTPVFLQCVVKGDTDVYTTLYATDGDWRCSCPWGRQSAPGPTMCSHAKAVRLTLFDIRQKENAP